MSEAKIYTTEDGRVYCKNRDGLVWFEIIAGRLMIGTQDERSCTYGVSLPESMLPELIEKLKEME